MVHFSHRGGKPGVQLVMLTQTCPVGTRAKVGTHFLEAGKGLTTKGAALATLWTLVQQVLLQPLPGTAGSLMS